ncbi:MAG: DUF1080 domain-containing protein [Verrucomicrobiota bacterium]
MKTPAALIPLLAALTPLPADTLFPDQQQAWKMAGPGEFQIEDDIATASGGMGLWWFSARQYQCATLSLEFKTTDEEDNSGIFIRFPDPGNDPWVAVKQGYEIQINGSQISNKHTGAIYDLQAPVENPINPPGEWNSYQIHTLQNEILVVLNNKLINVFQPEKGRGDKKGYFGIQNHDPDSPVQFRNITVTELPGNARAQDAISRALYTSYQFKKNPPKNADRETQWYDLTDFGPAHIQTWGDFYQGEYRPNAALKGLLCRPDPDNPNLVALFNMETLQWVTASNQGVSLDNTPWAGTHGTQNKLNNSTSDFWNVDSTLPAWASPDQHFTETRDLLGHGNYPHLKFNGYFRFEHQVILDYEVNGSRILDSLIPFENGIRRILEFEGHPDPFILLLADEVPGGKQADAKDQFNFIKKTRINSQRIWEFSIQSTDVIGIDYLPNSEIHLMKSGLLGISKKTKGGPALFPETFEVKPKLDSGDTPFLVDTIPLPPQLHDNPYHTKIRLTDLDFFVDGDRAALCTWDGDVWLLSGLNKFETLTWKRFASGLYEPLGLKIVNDLIHVTCRDGIWQVLDLNEDSEADHYKVFWNDLLITDNFHEYQFGLETDSEGYFYTAKASPVRPGGRRFDKIVPHNGCLFKIAPDGSSHEIIATGLRAPGGIGVGPNGEVTTGENEGTWQPACKLNYFTPAQQPVFLGVEQTRHSLEKPFHEPLCYFPMSVDNSGGGQIWVTPEAKIGLKSGELLHLSYGQSSIYRVLPQTLASGQMQGGVVKLPIKIASSAQRAAFHPDGSMYVTGMRGWQTNAASAAGLNRIRHNPGLPLALPEAMSAAGNKLTLTFDLPLDKELAEDPESFSIKRWKYIRGPRYGSGQFSIDNPDEEAEARALIAESKSHKKQDPVEVASATLSPDQKTITLTIPTLKPAQQMQIDYDLESTDGEILINTIYSTIHQN